MGFKFVKRVLLTLEVCSSCPKTGILSQNLAADIGGVEATLGSESMKLSERMERETRQGLCWW